MIDAINFGLSSNHVGRLKLNNTPQSLGKIKTSADGYTIPQCTTKNSRRENLNALLVVSGGFASIGIITDIFTRAAGLANNEISADAAKSIFKNSLFMALIGATCFGVFKLLEGTVLDKICK